ncbi:MULTISPECIES: alpha/beta hydrolase [Metabacillus]|jgi:carboxylesterase|uniref:Alpha/beta fold hydrolase n=1 Tax=Metabacillus rhizolycopersici TaxID=2875709 RepID=A0ABS7UQ33_9BACI|nr:MULTISPECIES: alpha/beta fold hydrolase [Metabacillus]MBZ5750266.1 alpha/beta fold hydrolase [Metabacillus rhizolycopersici]MCM3651533.1 alpha/beta fold hydrolase [Metabacillus litoralis]
MKVVAPKPFTYGGGEKAVLLLHGFTGSTADVKLLGKYLQQRGYTCHAPLYKGHGMEPNKLIQTDPDDWWQDVVGGYQFLKAEGFEEIAVAGISLGGVFTLKVGMDLPVKGIVSMCAPNKAKNSDDLYMRVRNYARLYKKFEGKDDEQISSELKELEQLPMPFLENLRQLIVDVGRKLDFITSPILVLQGCLDDPLYKESAQLIYHHVNTEEKRIKWYEQSGHIITLGKERETVYEDIVNFLDSLNW